VSLAAYAARVKQAGTGRTGRTGHRQ
jgi:hypothetical protein